MRPCRVYLLVEESEVDMMPNKIAAGAGRSAVVVPAASRRRFSFLGCYTIYDTDTICHSAD